MSVALVSFHGFNSVVMGMNIHGEDSYKLHIKYRFIFYLHGSMLIVL